MAQHDETGGMDDSALPDIPPEPDEKSWARWCLVFPGAVAAAAGIWVVLRYARLPAPVAQFHDQVILPVVLKGVYARSSVLGVCAAIAAVALILYPHGRRWPLLTMPVAALAAAWMILYEMMRNAPPSSFLVVGVVAYVLLRYGWKLMVRLPLVGRELFLSLSRYVDCNPRADEYYDAIRVATVPSSGSKPAAADRDLWIRRKLAGPTGFWARLFARAAHGYRTGRTPLWRRALRRLSGQRLPASLRNQYLWQILVKREQWARSHFRTNELGSRGEWKDAMGGLITACEARAEYLAFNPAGLPVRGERLLDVAAMYDHLARLTMIRQLWLANSEPPEPSPVDTDAIDRVNAAIGEIRDEWDQLGADRRELLQRSVQFRARYLGRSADDDPYAELKTLGMLSRNSGQINAVGVQLLVLAISRIQVSQLVGSDPGGEAPGGAEELLRQLGDAMQCAGRSTGRNRSMAARKALELGFDCCNARWADEVLAMELLAERIPTREEDYDDAAFEGHFCWWLARRTYTEETRLALYRQAAEAFCNGRRAELEMLKDEVRRLASQDAELHPV